MGSDHTVSFDVPEYFPVIQFAKNGKVSLNPKLEPPAGGSPALPKSDGPPGYGPPVSIDGGTYDGSGFFSSGLFGGEPYAEYTLRFSKAGNVQVRMSAASADGRNSGSDLTTEIEEATEQLADGEEARRRWRVTDVAFFVFFAAFFASVDRGRRAWTRVGTRVRFRRRCTRPSTMRALGTGPLAARIYQADGRCIARRVGRALVPSSASRSASSTSALAVFLLWLRPRDRTARLLAVGMVGTAAVFNLPSQTAIEIQPLLIDETIGTHRGAHPHGRSRTPSLCCCSLTVASSPGGAARACASLHTAARGRRLPHTARRAEPLASASCCCSSDSSCRSRPSPRRRTASDGRTTPREHQQARLLFWALLPALGVGMWFVGDAGLRPTSTPDSRAGTCPSSRS